MRISKDLAVAAMALALCGSEITPRLAADGSPFRTDYKRRSGPPRDGSKACIRDLPDLAERRKRQRKARQKARK